MLYDTARCLRPRSSPGFASITLAAHVVEAFHLSLRPLARLPLIRPRCPHRVCLPAVERWLSRPACAAFYYASRSISISRERTPGFFLFHVTRVTFGWSGFASLRHPGLIAQPSSCRRRVARSILIYGFCFNTASFGDAWRGGGVGFAAAERGRPRRRPVRADGRFSLDLRALHHHAAASCRPAPGRRGAAAATA